MNTNETVNIYPVGFQNGNQTILNADIERYVSNYKGFLKKTAEAILGLAQTLVEAESNLNGVDFAIFLDEVGLKRTDPTLSKLRKIGEHFHRFQPYADRLPNNWTTIYQLARLSSETFDKVADQLTPYITAAEVDELAGLDRARKPIEKADLKVSLEGLSLEQKKAVHKEIEALKERFGIKFRESPWLIVELKGAKAPLSEAA